MRVTAKPEQFEVIVTNNMFGDILTDLGAALQGGLGMAASGQLASRSNVGCSNRFMGRRRGPAGLGTANPIAAVDLALLDALGHQEAQTAVEDAVGQTI